MFLSVPAHAGDREDAAELLEMWNPSSVTLDNGALIVVLPQQRITEDIYMAALRSGLCLGRFFEMPLNGVTSVSVLNQFAKQGYVYEKDMSSCDALNAMPVTGSDAKIAILGATHLY
jgi:hypothetical protein